jgi:hypothetical protein
MEAHTLEQPIANKECRFYVMGTMQQYLGMSTTEGNKIGVYASHFMYIG